MANTGVKYPTSGTSVSGGNWIDNAWTTPGNITADDTSEASVTATSYDAGDQTEKLRATGFDFSSIPNGSTIDGIVVTFLSRYATVAVSADLCQLVNAATPIGDNKYATPQALTTSDAVYTVGSSTDKWNATLTTSVVKSATFGVDLGFLAGGSGNTNNDVYCEYVNMTVYYTTPLTDPVPSDTAVMSDSSVTISQGFNRAPSNETAVMTDTSVIMDVGFKPPNDVPVATDIPALGVGLFIPNDSLILNDTSVIISQGFGREPTNEIVTTNDTSITFALTRELVISTDTVTTNDTSVGTDLYTPPADNIILRSVKGSPLTMNEFDSNFTFLNTKLQRTVNSVASAATITPAATDTQYDVTALAVDAIIAIPSGTPINGSKLLLTVLDNGTIRNLSWTGTAGGWRSIGVTLPTATVAGKKFYIGAIYNGTSSYWDVVAVTRQE